MMCPFCFSLMGEEKRNSTVDDEISYWCNRCGAKGAIFKRKKERPLY
jgi:hypothetical protein